MSQQKSDSVVDIDAALDDSPDDEEVSEAVDNLRENGFAVVVVDSAEEALETLQSQIPAGASVMNGHSTTLEEIGFVDYLTEGDHELESLPDEIWSIDDDEQRQAARRDAQTADYFLGGINAVAQTG